VLDTSIFLASTVTDFNCPASKSASISLTFNVFSEAAGANFFLKMKYEDAMAAAQSANTAILMPA